MTYTQLLIDYRSALYCFDRQSLAENHLKYVAGLNIFFALFDGLFESVSREIRGPVDLGFSRKRDVGQFQVVGSLLQTGACFVEAATGGFLLGAAVSLRAGVRPHEHPLLDLIVDDHSVVEREI